MTFSLFRPRGNSLAGHNLTAFNLIYLPFWKKIFFYRLAIFNNVSLWIFLLGSISQIDPCKHVSCQYRWASWSSKSQNGACVSDTDVCGRGHQQIKRSRTLKAFPLPWHTPLCLVWVTHATMQFICILPKQHRQCCRLGPYAAPTAIHKSPVCPPWERLVDRKGCLAWELQG